MTFDFDVAIFRFKRNQLAAVTDITCIELVKLYSEFAIQFLLLLQ